MKGVVFCEFIEMVEDGMGLDVVDRMIEAADTSTNGAYTAVGTYDHTDLIQLVVALSKDTETPPADLVKSFGKYLFVRLQQLYPQFFAGIDSAFDFLPLVENYIHVEVRKLYPDAELPQFDCVVVDGNLEMTYQSSRPFADLAEGMLISCVNHFKESLEVTRENLGKKDGTEAKFTLTRALTASTNQLSETCRN